jgi:hypothetical protein
VVRLQRRARAERRAGIGEDRQGNCNLELPQNFVKRPIKKITGWVFVLVGLIIMVFSHRIVFPGLERIVGIETIVGKENVVYQSDGSYLFTNPSAMLRWIFSVVVVGLIVSLIGVWILIRARRKNNL